MSTQDLLQLVKSIPDGQAATITLTDLEGNRTHLKGIFKESHAPSFFFLCPPGHLPDSLDISRSCPFSCRDKNAADIALVVDIIERTNNRVLELEAKKTLRSEELRQFFRVTLRAKIIVRFFPATPDDNQQEWSVTGETVDISQSGVLTILPEECRNLSDLDLEIQLINPSTKVFCTGHVIHTKRLKKDRWLISFHFDNISQNDRDAIAKNCFAEQRRQLRDKGQTF
jgi:hypothetical protein